MSFFHAWLLLCSAIIAEMACPCFANSAPVRIGDIGKCGRDCIFYVCHRLDQQVSLDEIDQQLNSQMNVSFAIVRKNLEKRGLFCKSLTFNDRNIGRLQATLDRCDAIVAIAALPAVSETERHYVVITNCTNSYLTVFDIANNKIGTVNTADYNGKPIMIPVLLVSKKPIRYNTFSYFEILFDIVTPVIAFYFGYYFVIRKFGSSFYMKNAKLVFQFCFGWLTFRRLSIIGGTVAFLLVLFFSYRTYYCHKYPLEFIKKAIDLGDIEMFSKNDFYIEIRNRSFWSISIKDIQVSCSCLTIEEHPEIIKPRSIQKIKLSLVPLLRGKVSYRILVVPKSFVPIIGRVSSNGFERTILSPQYVNIGLVEKGEMENFSCAYIVEGLRGDSCVVESIAMHGDTPIFKVSSDVPKILREGAVFTITVMYLGNAPKGTFLQSFEIRGKNGSGKEITLVSNLVGYVVE